MISYTLLLIASVVPLWQIIVVAVLAAAVVALGITDTVLLIKNKKAEQPSQAAEQQTAEQVPQPTAAEQPLPQPPITETEDFDEEESVAAIPMMVDGKQVYVRYVFSFSAKLIQSPQEVQQRYGEIMDEVNAYAKVKTSVSWRQLRIYQGRKTLAVMLFKGRKLCMAFALNPKDYEETKYRGIDLSEVKRFEKTPMLLKLTSPRKVKYAKYLFEQVALANGLEKGEVTATEFSLPYRETEQLVAEGLVRKFVSGDAEGTEEVQVDISELIRSSITVNEAHVAISDSEAEKLVEKATPHDDAPEVAAAAAPAVYGNKRGIVNIDTLSAHFDAGDEVTLAQLIQKGLVQKNVGRLKVLARGTLDKPLTVCADDFSIDAVKMIVLTGGKAVKTD